MNDKIFIPLHRLSQRLGLPSAWLKGEAEAGRVPCLRAGRRLLFNPKVVEETLIKRAQHAPRKEVPNV